MAITTVVEAHAVSALERFLLPRDKPASSEDARDALGILAEAAYKKLQAGPRNKDIADRWARHVVLSQVARALYGDDYNALLADLSEALGIATAHLDRAWFEQYRDAPLTDDQWDDIRPHLRRYAEEIADTWVNERFADEVLEQAHIPPSSDSEDTAADDEEATEEPAPDGAEEEFDGADQHEPEPEPDSADEDQENQENEEETSEEEADEPNPTPAEEEDNVDLPPDGEEVDEPPTDEEPDIPPEE
ncbi:hypothetical protein ABZ801_01150 [Actinomadura sp. NPDC047616]|uniref:hypothetical protein n=1 Tax=Actinomadura sp. NPDC047616 TaxID=3155914 RepID=UPI0033FD8A66